MKKIFLSLLLFITVTSVKSQTSIIYEDVVQVDSITQKEQLYQRGLVWVSESFKNANEVLQIKDEENGKIVGKGNFEYEGVDDYYRGRINFSFKLLFKEGRYKYEFSDFNHKGEMINVGDITDIEDAPFKAFGSTKKYRNREWKNMKSEISSNVKIWLSTLNKSMLDSDDEDW